jgi:signal transduction histidine kinase
MLLRDSEREAFTSVPRHAQIILEQSRRMEILSKGLMDFSSAQLRIERLDINALVQRSMEFVRSQNKFDGVEWDLKLAGGVPELRADPGQIQQVLLNLFINAAEAMAEASSPRRTISVTTGLEDRDHRLTIVVTDSGPGIPLHHLGKVFEPHFTTKPEGHGFRAVDVVSHPRQSRRVDRGRQPDRHGATFTLRLPLHGPGHWA